MNRVIICSIIFVLIFHSLLLRANDSSALIFEATKDNLYIIIIGTQHNVLFPELPEFIQEFLERQIKESDTLLTESIASEKVTDLISLLIQADAFNNTGPSENIEHSKLIDIIKNGVKKKFNANEQVLQSLSLLKPWAALMIASYFANAEKAHGGIDSTLATKFVLEKLEDKPIKYFGLETMKVPQL